MIPPEFRNSSPAWDGTDRRRGKVEQQRSTDRELGELVATVKALSTKIDEDRAATAKGFSDLSAEIEKLAGKFESYKEAHDDQSGVEIAALDSKIKGLDRRVMNLETTEENRKQAAVNQDKTMSGRFRNKMIDVAATIATTGILGFIGWLAIQYLTKGAS